MAPLLLAPYRPLLVDPDIRYDFIEGLEHVESWRLNLSAASIIEKNVFYVAVHRHINVYRLTGAKDEKPAPVTLVQCPSYENAHGPINAIRTALLGKQEVLVAADDSNYIHVWLTNALDRAPIALQHKDSVWGLALHGPKYLLAASANSHTVMIWNLRALSDAGHFQTNQGETNPLGDGVESRELVGHENNVPSISFSQCGNLLVSCSIDCSFKIWNVRDGTALRSSAPSSQWCWSAVFVQPLAFKHIPVNTPKEFNPINGTVTAVNNAVETRLGRDAVSIQAKIEAGNQGPEATTFDDDKDDIRGQRLSVTDWEEEFVDDPCDHLEGFLNEPEVVFEEHVWSGSEEDDEGANQGETEPMAHSEGVDTGRAIRQDVLLPSCSSEMKQDLSRGGDGPETPPLHPRTPPEDTPAPTTEIHNARPYDDFGFDDDDDDFGPYDEDSNDEYQNYIDDIIDAQQAYPYWHDAESEAGEAMDPEGSLPPLVYEDDTDEAGDHLSNDSGEDSQPSEWSSSSGDNDSNASSVAEGHSNNIWEGLDEGGTSNEEIQGQHWGGLPDPDENESNLSDEMPPYGGMDIFEQHGPGINQEAHFPEDMLEYEHQLDILQSFPFLAAQINWWRERQNRRTEPEPAPWVDWTYRDTCPFYIVDDHGVSTRRSCCEDEDSTVAELVLGATVNTLYLMDCPKGTDSLRILHSLPRVVASLDTRMDPMLAHFDRLCFLEWIPFLSCAMVASQKGSAAVVRILRTHSPERGESQFKMIVERVIPQLPPSAPLIGMFIDETRGKEFFERRREYRVNLLYGDSSMLTYSLQASRMINPLNGKKE